MKVEVRLFSYFCNLSGEKGNRSFFDMEIEEEMTCADLLTALNISLDLPIVILVNGSAKEKNCILQEGDKVSILPLIEGG